jgi:hypothetical protein
LSGGAISDDQGEDLMRIILCLLLAALVSGCGVAAAPCRVGSAGLKMVPLVGHVAAAPTDACAEVIDP